MMELDHQKIDDAVLALLMLGFDGNRAWKGFDWNALGSAPPAGLIGNPRSKAKSVAVTEEGEARGRRLLAELFGRMDGGQRAC